MSEKAIYHDKTNRLKHSNIISFLSIKASFLIALPVLTLLGTQLGGHFEDSKMLLLMILLVALIPILVTFDKIPERLYQLAIVTTAIALLYSTSLNSAYLWGADVHQEYYFANLVKDNSFWDSTIPHDYNAMLSVVMLAPILSTVSGMSLIWVFKIIYPLLFSLVPLILYRVFALQIDSKKAFLATFFFVSVFTFYTEMIGLARQQIGEIFLALLLLLIVGKDVIGGSRGITVLLIIFGALLPLSHYSVAYIFMWSAIIVLLISFVAPGRMSSLKGRGIISVSFVFYYSTVTIGWYVYVSGSVTFDRFLNLINRIAGRLFTEFLNPQSTQGLSILVSGRASPLHDITKMLHILMALFIAVGILWVMLGRVKEKLDKEYFSFSLMSFVLCIFAITVPYLAKSLNTTRLYHITLVILAPFCVIGAGVSFKLVSNAFRLASRKTGSMPERASLKLLSIILSVFLLFNTGFVYELAKSGSSIANPYWAIEHGDAKDRISLYNAYTPVEEIASATWLSQHRADVWLVYSDYRARNNALNAYATISRDEGLVLREATEEIDEKSYIYLRRMNMFDCLIEGPRSTTGPIELFNASLILSSLSQKANLIYSNAGSKVYYTMVTISLKDD